MLAKNYPIVGMKLSDVLKDPNTAVYPFEYPITIDENDLRGSVLPKPITIESVIDGDVVIRHSNVHRKTDTAIALIINSRGYFIFFENINTQSDL